MMPSPTGCRAGPPSAIGSTGPLVGLRCAAEITIKMAAYQRHAAILRLLTMFNWATRNILVEVEKTAFVRPLAGGDWRDRDGGVHGWGLRRVVPAERGGDQRDGPVVVKLPRSMRGFLLFPRR